jgi:hypothetical protein
VRVNVVIALGVSGEEKDLEEFLELWRADSEIRAHKIADKIMGGRVTILPLPEVEEGDSN